MTKKEKRLLTVLGTIFALAIAIVLIGVPYARKLDFYNKTIDLRQTLIYKFKKQISNKPALQNEIQTLDALMDDSKLFIQDVDKASAASTLLSSVKKMVETAGGEINSVNMVQQRKNGNKVSAKVSFISDNNGIIEIMKNLSSSQPMMNISAFRLAPVLDRKKNKYNDTGDVRIDMTVDAFFVTRGSHEN